MSLYRIKSISEMGSRQPMSGVEPVPYYQIRFEESNEYGETAPASDLIMSVTEEDVGNWRVGGLYDFSKVEKVPLQKRPAPDVDGNGQA